MNTIRQIAIYLDGKELSAKINKLGLSVILFNPNEVSCIICHDRQGKDAQSIVPHLPSTPTVQSLEQAYQLGANTLLFGLAPNGGKITNKLIDSMKDAINYKMQIIHGFHSCNKLATITKQHP